MLSIPAAFLFLGCLTATVTCCSETEATIQCF